MQRADTGRLSRKRPRRGQERPHGAGKRARFTVRAAFFVGIERLARVG